MWLYIPALRSSTLYWAMISLAAGKAQLTTFNSQLFYTPQSLRDSPPTLVGQFVFVLLISGL